MIGMTHNLRGVMQYKILGPIFHLCEHILASLQSSHTVNSQKHSTKPYVQPTFTLNEMFSTCIPTSLLNKVLLFIKIPTISLDAGTLTLKSIGSAFLDVNHIDIATLLWLSQTYFRTNEQSPDAILNVIKVILNKVHSGSTRVYTSTSLLQCYVDLCLTFPNSIPHKFTLTPIVNVLHQDTHAASLCGMDTHNKNVGHE